MSIFFVKFKNGDSESIPAREERDVWVSCDSDENPIISVECVGYKVNGEWL